MIQDTLFEPDAKAFCLICEIDGQAVGFAIYFFNYSTWLGKYGIYLEDLYVSPEHRGKGAGKALLIHIAKIATAITAVVLNGVCWTGILPQSNFINPLARVR